MYNVVSDPIADTPMNWIFITLLCIPVLEIAVLISVGGLIGLPLTILFILITAVLGTFLLRQQGLSLLLSAQEQMVRGKLPAQTLVEGVAVAVGGALLLTPGFITDVFGFMCLVPGTRLVLVLVLKKYISVGPIGFRATEEEGNSSVNSDGVTIEGEFKRDK